MNDCLERTRLHDYLDGELPQAAAEDYSRHLDGCEACRAELRAYRRLSTMLASASRIEPPAYVTERVLEAVLPSRQRQRERLRQVGMVYAGALAACLAVLGIWLSRPGTLSLFALIGATASRRLIQLCVFTVNSATGVLLNLAGGWGMVSAAGAYLAPLGRALAVAFGQVGVGLALAPAALACAALLWWMRSRRSDSNGRIGNVGVLGF
jgi:predicted anti-sigma-YlaC factor YlaD